MSIKLYIEAKDSESWKDLSRDFGQYILEHQKPKQFGIVEADPLENDALSFKLWGFSIKQEYSESVKYFQAWASSLDRVFGVANGANVALSNGLNILLPTESKVEVPKWLM